MAIRPVLQCADSYVRAVGYAWTFCVAMSRISGNPPHGLAAMRKQRCLVHLVPWCLFGLPAYFGQTKPRVVTLMCGRFRAVPHWQPIGVWVNLIP